MISTCENNQIMWTGENRSYISLLYTCRPCLLKDVLPKKRTRIKSCVTFFVKRRHRSRRRRDRDKRRWQKDILRGKLYYHTCQLVRIYQKFYSTDTINWVESPHLISTLQIWGIGKGKFGANLEPIWCQLGAFWHQIFTHDECLKNSEKSRTKSGTKTSTHKEGSSWNTQQAKNIYDFLRVGHRCKTSNQRIRQQHKAT